MMKYYIFFLLLQFNVFAQNTADNINKVLFVGNSITYYNNMPETFKEIANSKGYETEVTVYSPGGTGFVDHLNSDVLSGYFEQGGWDYVILQPGSGESVAVSYSIEDTTIRANQLIDKIREYSPCAKIMYYEISYGIWGTSAENLVTYNATMDLIKSNFEHLADETQLPFAPAGEAVKAAWNNDQTTILWGGAGDIHPNEKGSYLIACTLFTSIFQEPSLGTTVINSLTNEEASLYQSIGDETVLSQLPDWRISTYHQYSNFDYEINNGNVSFTNGSSNYESVNWSFGDGNSSSETNPTYNYSSNGTYEVTLTTTKNGCENIKTKTITIDSLSLGLVHTKNLNIYPNPFTTELIIESTNNSFKIHTPLGRDVTSLTTFNRVGDLLKINTSSLSNGSYIITINNQSYKLIK